MQERQGAVAQVCDVEIHSKGSPEDGVGDDQSHEGGAEEEGKEEIMEDGGEEEERQKRVAVDVESVAPLHFLFDAVRPEL